MSKGNDSRTRATNDRTGRSTRDSARSRSSRSSRSSVRMTPERARAIQAHADHSGRNQDFKSRAMSAADKNQNDEE
jgi:hypothetical protein